MTLFDDGKDWRERDMVERTTMTDTPTCPYCGSGNTRKHNSILDDCLSCGKTWNESDSFINRIRALEKQVRDNVSETLRRQLAEILNEIGYSVGLKDPIESPYDVQDAVAAEIAQLRAERDAIHNGSWSTDVKLIEVGKPYYVIGPKGLVVMRWREASDIGHKKYKGRRAGEWYRKTGSRPLVQPSVFCTSHTPPEKNDD